MNDHNRKTLRSFYCLDTLWSTFEQYTRDFGVSMDTLINESMRQYAEGQNMQMNPSTMAPQASSPQPVRTTNGFGRGAQNSAVQPGFPMNPQRITQGPQGATSPLGPGTQPQPQAFGSQRAPVQQPFGAPPPPPRPNAPYQSQPQQNWVADPQIPSGFLSPQQLQAPPQPPRPQAGNPQSQNMHQPNPTGNLYLYFDNNRYIIGKEDFVIGRGSQRTDLTIRDGNISRRHCAILHRNGSHYIKDLGSTNGVEFQGNRIESKRISEGDIFYLCDYELRFSYQ